MAGKIEDFFRNFFKAVAKSKLAVVGFIITFVIFPVLLVSIFLDMQGVIKNPYFGFLIYMVMGPLFGLGLIFVGAGMLFSRDGEDIGLFTIEYIKEQLEMPGRFSRVRKLIYLASFLTFFTILVVGMISYTGFHYTESTSFCGMFCHNVMEPEYVAYQNSPHSRVPCVDCHIGEDAELFTKAKISGFRQLFAAVFDTYERPIDTPIGALRPSRNVCEECHRPEMFHGDKLYVKNYYRPDLNNTKVMTVMLMKVGTGGYKGQTAHDIHWHVSPDHKIFYTYIDEDRKDIIQVRLISPDGSEEIFARKGYKWIEEGKGKQRVMDCMDCHNRPTHVFLPAGEAVDQYMENGAISTSIPFIKREALKVVKKEYQNKKQAQVAINRHIFDWYTEKYPELVKTRRKLFEDAVEGIYQAYADNVFPQMNISWNTYENFIGHDSGSGCFRCHNKEMVTPDGRSISTECITCHVILAEREKDPNVLKTLKGGK